MSERDTEYSRHSVWTRLDAVDSALDGAEEQSASPSAAAVDIQQRARAVLRHVRSVLSRSDPALVPMATLTAIDGALQKVLPELRSFAASVDEQHLVNTSDLADRCA